ncbi:MAG: hypothetical protein LKJ83_08645 [Eubacteriaceae bacterium]|nr:hypothetical protein [Eubacteriaceae bacterium]
MRKIRDLYRIFQCLQACPEALQAFEYFKEQAMGYNKYNDEVIVMINEEAKKISDVINEFEHSPLDYLTYDAVEQFESCFDWTFKILKPGEQTDAEGKLGILLYGNGVIIADDRTCTAEPGMPFGVMSSNADTDKKSSYLAATESGVILSKPEIMDRTCYGGCCWFHARLLMELAERQ